MGGDEAVHDHKGGERGNGAAREKKGRGAWAATGPFTTWSGGAATGPRKKGGVCGNGAVHDLVQGGIRQRGRSRPGRGGAATGPRKRGGVCGNRAVHDLVEGGMRQRGRARKRGCAATGPYTTLSGVGCGNGAVHDLVGGRGYGAAQERGGVRQRGRTRPCRGWDAAMGARKKGEGVRQRGHARAGGVGTRQTGPGKKGGGGCAAGRIHKKQCEVVIANDPRIKLLRKSGSKVQHHHCGRLIKESTAVFGSFFTSTTRIRSEFEVL